MNTWASIFSALMVALVSGGGAVTIKGIFDRRSVDVNADEKQVDMAIKMYEKAVVASEKATADVDRMQEEIRKLRSAVIAHEAWDRRVIFQLERLGVEVGPPPEIYYPI